MGRADRSAPATTTRRCPSSAWASNPVPPTLPGLTRPWPVRRCAWVRRCRAGAGVQLGPAHAARVRPAMGRSSLRVGPPLPRRCWSSARTGPRYACSAGRCPFVPQRCSAPATTTRRCPAWARASNPVPPTPRGFARPWPVSRCAWVRDCRAWSTLGPRLGWAASAPGRRRPRQPIVPTRGPRAAPPRQGSEDSAPGDPVQDAKRLAAARPDGAVGRPVRVPGRRACGALADSLVPVRLPGGGAEVGRPPACSGMRRASSAFVAVRFGRDRQRRRTA